MREPDDAPMVDCPACGVPTAGAFSAVAACPRCAIALQPAAQAAQAAIDAVESAVVAAKALPTRLQAGLKARLYDARQVLSAALAAGARIDAEAELVVAEPAVAEPVVAEPAVAEPAVAEPAVAEPVAEPVEPSIAAPVAAEPAITAAAFGEVDPPAIAEPEDAQPAEPTAPSLWQRLGPAFAEHLLFFLGGFLLLAGAVYFVSTAWTTMTGSAQLLVIEGGILLFGAGLIGAGRLLNRDRTLDDLDGVLATAGAACVPVAALAVGRQALGGVLPGLGGVALWVAAGFPLLRWGLGRVTRAPEPVVGALLAAALGAVVGPLVPAWPVLAAALPIAVGAWAATRGTHWSLHAVAAIAALATAGQVALHTGAWGVLALPLGASGVVFSRHRALSHADDLVAVGLGIGAFVIAVLTPNAALICAAAGCVVASRAALNRERGGLLIAALVLGLAAYVLLPAPIKGVVLALKAKASAGLGYSGGRLPLAWYGVTCLPYVALCGWAARRLRETSLARTARLWTLGIAAGLCLLAFTTSDLRAPLLVLPLEGLLLLGLAFWLPAVRMAQAAPVLLAAAPILATVHFDLPLSTVPVGIAAIALTLRVALPRRGAVVHGVYQSCMWLLAGAAGLAVVPAAWVGAAVHWLDLLAAPLVVLAVWPIPRLRPLALLALHRMIPALAALTGLWTWPVAALVAAGGVLATQAWRKDRHPALVGWALLLVAVLGGAYAIPVGADLSLGLLGAAVVGVALAWGTGHSPLAAVALLCLAGSAAALAWTVGLRPSRVGMSAAIAVAVGVVALGWIHRRHAALYARIGRAPSVLGLVFAILAVAVYLAGDGADLIKKRALITLGVGLLVAMAASPRVPRLKTGWALVGVAALWLVGRGVVGVLPVALPVASAALLAALLGRILLRVAPAALPGGIGYFDGAWRGLLFIGLLQTVSAPAIGLASAAALLISAALSYTRRSLSSDALTVAALAGLLVGPVLGALGLHAWAPVALFVFGAAGYRAQARWQAVPRGFAGLLGVVGAAWLILQGAALATAVWAAQVQVGPLSVGVGWLAFGAAAAVVFGRRAPGRVLGSLPLLWWAPVATLLADGPARGAPGIAALLLVHAAFARQRPRFTWAWLAGVALLCVGLWTHPLVPLTAGLITATIALVGWRWGRPLETESTPWLLAAAGSVAALWSAPVGSVPLGTIGVAAAAGALLAALTRRHAATTWALAAGGLCGGFALTGSGVLAAGLATLALATRAWRSAATPAREGAAVFGAIAAGLIAWWLAPGAETLPMTAVAALGAIAIAALARTTGITVGVLAGCATLLAVAAPVLFRAPGVVWPGGVAGLALIALPLLVWWRRAERFAQEFVCLGVAAAAVLGAGWLQGAHLTDAVVLEAAWLLGGVAVGAAAWRRAHWVVGLLAGLALWTHLAGPLEARHLLSAGLVAAAFGLQGRRHGAFWDLAFGALAWAAFTAVWITVDGSLRWVLPWTGAAVAAVTVGAALARRSRITISLLALVAALATGLQTLHGGTACTAVLLVGALAITGRRNGGLDRLVAWLAAPLALTAVIGWALGLDADLPLLAWGAAATALTSAAAARIGRGVSDTIAAATLAGATLLGLLTVAGVGAPIGVAGVALVIAFAALVIGWAPLMARTPRAVHAVLGLLAALHLALRSATPWLSLLDGHHFEAWGVLGALIAVVRSLVPVAVRRELTAWCVVLPLLALGTAGDAATAARAAFVGALAWGMIGRDGPKWLRYAAFGLANVGAWAACLSFDLVDPTLYGLPPGLTLLALAEVERARLSTKAHVALLSVGFALAYGGMAVQIVTSGGALHAALLLAGGLVSVGVGWRLRRADLLIGGTAAVILDVACYLIRHGFQQSFISAGLLLFAGATVLLAATVAARMRRAA